MGLLDRRWLILPWLAVAIFAALAASDDYAQFQKDKTAQQKTLTSVRDTLGKTADAWIEQGREVVEHYRTEEERQSILKSIKALEGQNKLAREEMKKLPRTLFFPETVQAEEMLGERLENLANITQGLFQAKTDLLAAQVQLVQVPHLIQYYRQRSRYFSIIGDYRNYLMSQNALTESESIQIELQDSVDDLQAEVGEWQQKLDLEHFDMLDDITAINDALKREEKMDYSSYLKARWRTFKAKRALHST